MPEGGGMVTGGFTTGGFVTGGVITGGVTTMGGTIIGGMGGLFEGGDTTGRSVWWPGGCFLPGG